MQYTHRPSELPTGNLPVIPSNFPFRNNRLFPTGRRTFVASKCPGSAEVRPAATGDPEYVICETGILIRVLGSYILFRNSPGGPMIDGKEIPLPILGNKMAFNGKSIKRE